MASDARGWGRGAGDHDPRRDAVRRARATPTGPASATERAVEPTKDPTRDPWAEPWDDEPRPPLARRVVGGGLRFVTGLVLVVAVAIAGFAAGAFLRYLDRVDGYAPPALSTVARADAIAVLTGGSDRIAAGGRLLESGLADRLLVSGVNPAATERQLRGLLGVGPDLFRCCVTLGFAALDTRGNAGETARWIGENVPRADEGPTRVIVVTANYHMERALLELTRAMPGVALDPYPVLGVNLDGDWWADASNLRVILGEFMKLQLARASDLPVVGARLGTVVHAPGPLARPAGERGA